MPPAGAQALILMDRARVFAKTLQQARVSKMFSLINVRPYALANSRWIHKDSHMFPQIHLLYMSCVSLPLLTRNFAIIISITCLYNM
jgi:hypothetical protein